MATADLAWDYTGDEESPLLSSATTELRRSEQKCVLTQRQVLHLLHNLQEASQILSDEQRRNSLASSRRNRRGENVETVVGGCWSSVLRSLYRTCSKLKVVYIYLVMISLLVVSASVDSLLDVSSCPHVPFTSIVATFVSSLGLAVTYCIFGWRVINQEIISGTHLVFSYIVTAILFASLYTAFPCSQTDCGESSLYILNFLGNFHASLSVLMLSYYGQLQYHCWNYLTFVTIQMVLSYCHLLLALLTFLPKMLRPPKSLVPPLNVEDRLNDDPLLINPTTFDETASYTFNQSANMFGSTDPLGQGSRAASLYNEPLN